MRVLSNPNFLFFTRSLITRLSCGEVGAGASLKLTLEAERGALSIFEANSQFHSSSCPAVATRGWWLESRSHLGFWTLASWRDWRIIIGRCSENHGRTSGVGDDGLMLMKITQGIDHTDTLRCELFNVDSAVS